MAKKVQGCDYSTELKKLKNDGPGNTYLLYGPEDYLRDSFLSELKKICIPEGENGFNYHRFDGDTFDEKLFLEAVNSIPFMGDRSFVEVHDPDFSRISIDDIPYYCTVAFISNDIDARLKVIKQIQRVLCFSGAEQSSLIRWIKRRFEANGKSISDEAVKRLIFISGDLMNMLIPEIDKISSYSKGDSVSIDDVNAAANHIADADVFEMVNCISQKKYDSAVGILAELEQDKNNSAISVLSSLSYQFRRIYAAKCCSNISALMDLLGIKYDFIARNLYQCANSFSMDYIRNAIRLCCDVEYSMKNSHNDDYELIKYLIIRLWKS